MPSATLSNAAALSRNEQFVHLVMVTRQELKSLYGDSLTGDCPNQNRARTPAEAAHLREEKARIIARLRENYAQLKTQWGGLSVYDRWFAKSLNNAQLNTVAAYFDLVPGFRVLLKQQGGDLEKFYRLVRSLGKLKKQERHQKVKAAAETASDRHEFHELTRS